MDLRPSLLLLDRSQFTPTPGGNFTVSAKYYQSIVSDRITHVVPGPERFPPNISLTYVAAFSSSSSSSSSSISSSVSSVSSSSMMHIDDTSRGATGKVALKKRKTVTPVTESSSSVVTSASSSTIATTATTTATKPKRAKTSEKPRSIAPDDDAVEDAFKAEESESDDPENPALEIPEVDMAQHIRRTEFSLNESVIYHNVVLGDVFATVRQVLSRYR